MYQDVPMCLYGLNRATYVTGQGGKRGSLGDRLGFDCVQFSHPRLGVKLESTDRVGLEIRGEG